VKVMVSQLQVHERITVRILANFRATLTQDWLITKLNLGGAGGEHCLLACCISKLF
jgi:hypothetical protein